MEWKNPPERMHISWPVVAEELRAHPEQWACVISGTTRARVTWVRKTLGDGFEVRSTKAENPSAPDRADIFARYVGKPVKAVG